MSGAGTLGVLNVGAGDTKLVFNGSDPAERIRAARIVKDMLRRGYALLIRDPADTAPDAPLTRVLDFREDTCEYIIADLDPIAAARADEADHAEDEASAEAPPGAGETSQEAPAGHGTARRRGRGGTKTIPAARTSGVAVARSAGG